MFRPEAATPISAMSMTPVITPPTSPNVRGVENFFRETVATLSVGMIRPSLDELTHITIVKFFTESMV